MSESPVDRRTVLAGLLALPAAGLVGEAAAQAPSTAPHLDEKDPMAVALAYVHDARKTDPAKNANYRPGQACHNCVQLVGKEGDTWRPCNLFPGKLVNKDGWCKVWVLKPGAKI